MIDVVSPAPRTPQRQSHALGSVHHESGPDGLAVQKHFQDAFGNTTEGWESGVWGGVRGGFHHNSKEFDEDAELVYMYQRWYLPEVGVFVSSAPYPPMVEHRFGFANNSPTMAVDPDGRWWVYMGPGRPQLGSLPITIPIPVPDGVGDIMMLTKEGKRHLRPGEVSLLNEHGIDAAKCYKRAHDASKSKRDPEANAMRHCVWQCCLSEGFGPQIAGQFGWAHETGPFVGKDYIADVTNNRIGRGFGCDRSSDCEAKCSSAWLKGRLARN